MSFKQREKKSKASDFQNEKKLYLFLFYFNPVNYLKGQEAYLLNTGAFTGYEEGVPIQVALSHDYFTIAVSVGQHLTYFDSQTGEQGDDIQYAHTGIPRRISFFHFIILIFNFFFNLL